MTNLWITDDSTQQPKWVLDRGQQFATNNYRDYAIIARFVDSDTGKPAFIAAGIGRGGTIAAGEFLTDPNDMRQLAHIAKAFKNKKNMEVVLSTQIIGGEPGTPRIEATYFW